MLQNLECVIEADNVLVGFCKVMGPMLLENSCNIMLRLILAMVR